MTRPGSKDERNMHFRNERRGRRYHPIGGGEDPALDLPSPLRLFAQDLEAILRSIDFEEVTTADRATFIEYAIETQVRRLVLRGRFDLAVRLRRFGRQRIAALREE